MLLKDTWYTWSQKTPIFYVLSNIYIKPQCIKNLNDTFLTKGPQMGKVKSKLENATWWQSWNWKCKICKKWHFQFQLRHQMALLNFYSTFPIYGTLPQKVSFRFLIRRVLTNFTKILLHVYQVSLTIMFNIFLYYWNTLYMVKMFNY